MSRIEDSKFEEFIKEKKLNQAKEVSLALFFYILWETTGNRLFYNTAKQLVESFKEVELKAES